MISNDSIDRRKQSVLVGVRGCVRSHPYLAMLPRHLETRNLEIKSLEDQDS